MYEVIITTPYNVIHYYVDSINNNPERCQNRKDRY